MMMRKCRIELSEVMLFTLVELIVVIAIIMVLIAMLLPTLGRAKAVSRQIQCIGNLKQLGLISGSYISDYGYQFPYGWKDESGVYWFVWGYPAAIGDYVKMKNTRLSSISATGVRCTFACPTVESANNTTLFTTNRATLGFSSLLGQDPAVFKGPNFPRPSKHCMIADAFGLSLSVRQPQETNGALRMWHNGSFNVLYADLHAALRRNKTFAVTSSAGSPFWSSAASNANNPD